MRQAVVVLISLVVLGALEALFQLGQYLTRKRDAELKRRLQLLGEGRSATLGLLRRDRYARSASLEAVLRQLPGTAGMEKLLAQADMPVTVAQLLGVSLLLGGLGAGVMLAIHMVWPAATVVALSLAILPTGLVLVQRTKRSERLSEQLPDALDMMSRSLRAGHSLPSALRLIASEMPTPASVEFGRAYEEEKLGLSVEEAVVNMTGRTPLNKDLKIFAVSVIVQKETGGNLAEILENIANTIRERYRFFAKLRALTAEGRTSGIVLGVLPPAMALFMTMSNPKYIAKLVDNDIGQMILAYAIASWIFGALWMQRMTKVDY